MSNKLTIEEIVQMAVDEHNDAQKRKVRLDEIDQEIKELKHEKSELINSRDSFIESKWLSTINGYIQDAIEASDKVIGIIGNDTSQVCRFAEKHNIKSYTGIYNSYSMKYYGLRFDEVIILDRGLWKNVNEYIKDHLRFTNCNVIYGEDYE